MKTKYEAGFTYYDTSGIKCTLIKWNGERWETLFEERGIGAMGFTDDCWIDLYTKKAFLNEQTHQITYYDKVDIIPKNNNILKVKITPEILEQIAEVLKIADKDLKTEKIQQITFYK